MADFAVIRHYHFDPKDGAEIDRIVREDFVPLIRKANGFIRYYWLDTGNGEGASFGLFRDKAGADESVRLAADFVRDHLSKLLRSKPEIVEGPVVVVLQPAGEPRCLRRQPGEQTRLHVVRVGHRCVQGRGDLGLQPRLLVQADAFHPRPGAKPLAAPPPFTINLVENIRRLKLDVERVVHLHGGIDPLAVVVKSAGG